MGSKGRYRRSARPEARRLSSKPSLLPRACRFSYLFSAALLAFVLLGGCAHATSSPEGTLGAFAADVRAGRYGRAYDRLDATYRSRVSRDEFVRRLESSPDEVEALLSALERPADETEVHAVVRTEDGDRLELTLEGGEWRFSRNPLDYYDQSTPERALRAFIRAVERRRFDILLRFVPNADREGLDEGALERAFDSETTRDRMRRLMAILRNHLDVPIEIHGDRATVQLAEGEVQMVLEDGTWRIEDIRGVGESE